MKIIRNKTPLMKIMETKFNQCVEELLRQKYVDENKPPAQIATELGIGFVTTINWLKLAGIYSRRLKI